MPVDLYFDHNSGTKLRDNARLAMEAALAQYGNASSIHARGRAQRALIEQARLEIADLVASHKDGVIFTCGATQAAHLALSCFMPKGQAIYVLASEHPCILSGAGREIREIPVLANGLIDETAFENMLEQHNRGHNEGDFCLAMQYANSESGVIQPVAKIAEQVKTKGGVILCDTVQAVGRLPIDINELGVDMILISAHKLGGPQGAGALVLANPDMEFLPTFSGGGQERHRRAGTENVAAIAGFGVAAKEAKQQLADFAKMETLRNRFEEKLQQLDMKVHIFGENAPRLANTSFFAIENLLAQTALIAFDLAGVAISSGSACSSGKVGTSHVLKAMGVNENLRECALRVSFGLDTKNDDIDIFFNILQDITFKAIIKTNSKIITNMEMET